jgi:hypothetical protein
VKQQQDHDVQHCYCNDCWRWQWECWQDVDVMGFSVCGARVMGDGGNSAMDGGMVAQLGWVMVGVTRGDATINQVKCVYVYFWPPVTFTVMHEIPTSSAQPIDIPSIP